MPIKEFICKKCGNIFETLCKVEENTYKCSKCGNIAEIKYTGKCNAYKKGGCSGNCSSCSGCK